MELIPVVSYVIQHGRCRSCRKAISPQYPLVEIATGAIFALSFYSWGVAFPAFLLALTFWLLFLIAIVDSRTQKIPDALNIPFVLFAVLFAARTGYFSLTIPALAAGFFFFQWVISRGKWVGTGDILLAIGIGFLLTSTAQVVLWLLLSYFFGGVAAIWFLTIHKKTRKDRLAFAPALAFAAFITVFWGERIFAVLMPGL
jgi:prepilin signal peptidase PulO-like enzyme (type II secretory pathway)